MLTMSDITRTVVLRGGAESLLLRRFSLTPAGGRRASFDTRRVTIGSSPDNDLSIDDPGVSRHHCRIEVSADGYRLVDLQSKNGTWISSVRIHDAVLADGATFSVGDARVRFDIGDEEVEIGFSGDNRFGSLLGRSLVMREFFALLEKVASTDATILIEGESGTGKEVAAQAVHDASRRRSGPFIVFDCSAVSGDLIESELFGHVKGAFTGAHADRAGAFEEAAGGTIFIDELGELATELQPKLLRVLEKREVRRVGSNVAIPVDVRVIAATNRRLREEMQRGDFREDLYYRFAVVKARIPPLRERTEDIPMLVDNFLAEVATQHGLNDLNVSYQTMQKLIAHPWPGNVRELRNFVERAAVLSQDGDVATNFLRTDAPAAPKADAAEEAVSWMEAAGVDTETPFKEAKHRLVEAFERAYWEKLLHNADGNVSRAARKAGVHRKSVEYILRKLDLKR